MSSNIGWLQRPGFKAESWNPIRARHGGRKGWHCVKCAPGCMNCYAEHQNLLGLRHGTKEPYTVQSKAEVYLDEKTLTAPLHWRDRRMVFVCSMSDLFGEWVPNSWTAKILRVIARCPKHTFLVLTKRAGLMAHQTQIVVPDPLPNLWAGTSISTQDDADKNLPWLAETRAAVRWVSYEPALGAVDFTPFFATGNWAPGSTWLVIGGESGPSYRILTIDHVGSAVRQCQLAGISVFVKQDSGPFPGKQGRIPDELWIQEWPEAAQAAGGEGCT